jgi:hypothetical protein
MMNGHHCPLGRAMLQRAMLQRIEHEGILMLTDADAWQMEVARAGSGSSSALSTFRSAGVKTILWLPAPSQDYPVLAQSLSCGHHLAPAEEEPPAGELPYVPPMAWCA